MWIHNEFTAYRRTDPTAKFTFADQSDDDPHAFLKLLHGLWFRKPEIEQFTPGIGKRWLTFEQVLNQTDMPDMDLGGYLQARVREFVADETLEPWCVHPLPGVTRRIHYEELPVNVGLNL